MATWSCVLLIVAVGCSGDSNQMEDIGTPASSSESPTTTSFAGSQPSTGAEVVASAPTVPESERPRAATQGELAARLENLDFPQLQQSVEDGQDWNGELVGWLYSNLAAPDIWLLCNAIDDSYPPGCGTWVELTSKPAIVTERPQQLETVNGIDGVPAVVISRSLVAIAGTFMHDSAVFVPTKST